VSAFKLVCAASLRLFSASNSNLSAVLFAVDISSISFSNLPQSCVCLSSANPLTLRNCSFTRVSDYFALVVPSSNNLVIKLVLSESSATFASRPSWATNNSFTSCCFCCSTTASYSACSCCLRSMHCNLEECSCRHLTTSSKLRCRRNSETLMILTSSTPPNILSVVVAIWNLDILSNAIIPN